MKKIRAEEITTEINTATVLGAVISGQPVEVPILGIVNTIALDRVRRAVDKTRKETLLEAYAVAFETPPNEICRALRGLCIVAGADPNKEWSDARAAEDIMKNGWAQEPMED